MAGAAELAGAPDELVEGLAEAARHMGVLFQIQDDTLDLYADKGREQRGSDIAEGKRSALVVHAMQHADEKQVRWLVGVLDKDRAQTSQAEVERAIELLRETGSLGFALDEIERRKKLALGVASVAQVAQLQTLVAGMCDLFLKPIEPLLASRN